MKLIIDIPEMAYEAFKEWHKNKVATVEQSIIANGKPYEEKPKGDLISREALLKAMEEERQYLLARGQTGAEHILVHHCLPLIDNAPTVEIPTELCKGCRFLKDCETCEEKLRPQGEWLAHEDMDGWYECNKCYRGNTYFDKLPNFCPNCGADMRGAK